MGPAKSKIIDNNPALQGGAEFWAYNGNAQDFVNETVEYGPKYTLRTTLVRGKKNVYTFTMFIHQNDPSKEDKANKFYNEITKSFHALK